MKPFVLGLLFLSTHLFAAAPEATSYHRLSPTGPKGELIYGEEAFTGDALPVTILNTNLPGNKVLVKTAMDVNRTVKRSYIATTNGCMKNICVNDQVITGRLTKAKVLAHFEDGSFVTRDSLETTIWSYKDLALQEGCTTKFCRGDNVLNAKGKELIIDGFFGNGDYLVQDSKRGRLSIAQGSALYITYAVCRNIPIKRPGVCHHH